MTRREHARVSAQQAQEGRVYVCDVLCGVTAWMLLSAAAAWLHHIVSLIH